MNNNLRSVRALSFIIIVAVLLGMISAARPAKPRRNIFLS